MEFRIHEVLAWIVPGIYLIFLCVIFALCGPHYSEIAEIISDINVEDFSDLVTALAIFTIPVLGLIVGYAVNFMASLMEHLIYKIHWIPRPSNRILNNNTKRSKVAEISELYGLVEIPTSNDGKPVTKLDNATARSYRDVAVQAIDHETMERYYFRMIFGRNMTMSQLLAFIFSFMLLGFNIAVCMTMAVFLAILVCAYYRDSMTHTKYSFVEYMRIRQSH